MQNTDTNTPESTNPGPGPKAPAFSVLVADDDPAYHSLIRDMLTGCSVEFHTADNGQEALVALRNHPIQLVFMDVIMPELNGIDATALIRKMDDFRRPVPIYIIGVSAHFRPEDAITAGMDDFLQKPFRRDAFVSALEKYKGFLSQHPA